VAAAEEFRRGRAGVVGKRHGDERETARALLHAGDAADDDRFALGERRDRLRNAPVTVRARQVREQLLGRFDPEFGKLRHRRRTDAG
jgi:hypothetical protein